MICVGVFSIFGALIFLSFIALVVWLVIFIMKKAVGK